jgi:hypothetical protein
MSPRKSRLQRARELITDNQLIEFLRLVRDDDVFAVELVNRDLDEGKSLDSIFRSDETASFELSVKRDSPSTLGVSVGCQVGPDCGDGGEWIVTLDDRGRIISAEARSRWIS